MKITKTWTTYFLALLMLLVLVFPSCGLTAFADEATETVYTNVLDDLSTDENFTTDDYPEDLEDYSLSVIQIAESSDGELFVYVYQPSGQSIDLRASYINMAQSESAETTSLHNLTYLNSSGTLYKYMVDDITLSTDTLRYYNISSIYRPTIEGIDETVAYEDQEITYVAYAVGQNWEVYTYNSDILYTLYVTDVVTITNKYVGYIFYQESGSQKRDVIYGTKNYFVAFSTDYNIDKLLSVKISYVSNYYYYDVDDASESYDCWTQVPNPDYEDFLSPSSVTNEEVILNADGVTSYTSPSLSNHSGIFYSYFYDRETYCFSQISSASEFITDETRETTYSLGFVELNKYSALTDEAESAISSMDYVLEFTQTYFYNLEYIGFTSSSLGIYEDTIVSDVTILELTFEVDGETYSIGAVDNMQSSGSEPSNETGSEWDWSDWLKNLVEWLQNNWQYILIGIACVIVLIICAPFLPSILSFIVQAVRWLFKGIWWLIQQIAKGIVWIFTSVKDAIDSLTK